MKPIKIVTWQCPVCETVYDTKEESVECLSQPEAVPRYSEGDIVYLVDRFPGSRTKVQTIEGNLDEWLKAKKDWETELCGEPKHLPSE